MNALSKQHIYQYRTNGFINAGPLITELEADELAKIILKVIERKNMTQFRQPDSLRNISSEPEKPIWQIVNIWKASDNFKNLLRNPLLKKNVEELTGYKKFKLWHDQVQYKPEEKGGRLAWHQDLPKWPVMKFSGTQITAWIALDNVGTHNGCMSMVPGSHKLGNQNRWLHNQNRDWKLSKHIGFDGIPPQVMCPVQKGHVHFHHSLTWHGSAPNQSGFSRRAIALHFMASDTLYNEAGEHVMKKFIACRDGDPISGDSFLSL